MIKAEKIPKFSLKSLKTLKFAADRSEGGFRLRRTGGYFLKLFPWEGILAIPFANL